MNPTMTPLEAVKTIYRENRTPRRSTTSAKRLVRAFRAVGLSGAELIEALHYYDYCDALGEPYGKYIKRVW